MKKALLGVAVLVMVTAACAIGAPAPTATPYPTNTPYPTYTSVPTATPAPTDTPVPPTATMPSQEVVAVLKANGFTEVGRDVCKEYNPCVEYWHESPKMLVTVYGDGVVGYTFGVSKDMDTNALATLLNDVLGPLYPEEMNSWIAGHMAKTLTDGPQDIKMDGYEIYIQFNAAKDSNSSATIAIMVAPLGVTPAGGFTS